MFEQPYSGKDEEDYSLGSCEKSEIEACDLLVCVLGGIHRRGPTGKDLGLTLYDRDSSHVFYNPSPKGCVSCLLPFRVR